MEHLIECAKEVFEEQKNSLIKNYGKLKSLSNNFNDLIEDEVIKLNYKTEKIFYDFLLDFNDIYPCFDTNKFEEVLTEKYHGKEAFFLKNVCQYSELNKLIREQTKFLRILKDDEFEDLISYTFNNCILYNSIIEQYKAWTASDVNIVRKTINTILSSVINDFEDFNMAFLEAKIRFEFSDYQFKFIWDLCEKNKIYLMLKNITEKIDKIDI